MIAAIATVVASALTAAGFYMKLKASSAHQRRIAEADVDKETTAAEAKKAEIREAVFSNDDDRLNQIVSQLLAPVLFCAVFGAVFLGCATRPAATVYVPTDRRIETCTNSLGIVCKAVPNAVFAELLEKAQELKDLKTSLKVDQRISR